MNELNRDNFLPYRLYECVVGSHAYGLANDGSDVDIRGIYLAPFELINTLNPCPSHISYINESGDYCYYELKKYLELALKNNPTILEVIYTNMGNWVNNLGQELLIHRSRLLSSSAYKTYSSYSLHQHKKTTGKARMHAVRLLLSAIHLFREGEPLIHVGAYRDLLLDIGRSTNRDEQHVRIYEDLYRELTDVAQSNPAGLPPTPDRAWANSFLLSCREWSAQVYGAI